MNYWSLCGCLRTFIGYAVSDRRRVKLLTAFSDRVRGHYSASARCLDKAGKDPAWLGRRPLPAEEGE